MKTRQAMTDCKYKAAIAHNEKTVLELYKTQYYAYDKVRLVARFMLGFVFIIVAVAVSIPIWLKGILLLLGAWLVSTPDFPSQVIAEKNLDARKSALPVMNYEFYDDYLTLSGEGNVKIPYNKITLLIKAENYLYLFISKNSACMIDKSTLINQDATGFMNFIESKTKLQWATQKSFISMNIHDLRRTIKFKEEGNN